MVRGSFPKGIEDSSFELRKNFTTVVCSRVCKMLDSFNCYQPKRWHTDKKKILFGLDYGQLAGEELDWGELFQAREGS